ncbi:TonB-dependent receptor plug domain-containing protein [Horticoccus luteus]|uniref:TonB-dependent receptor plug domain-containing protein n=1 Tax=Horticoccus luteus TaxID=2862869 RepID=A0A8F9TTQ2_9BACT|nr:TonB-dependent receptor plug domain-containing protein [Horticoccus luteus]QYM78886.1 TonB-dependent receptor plug domain-containing protein [Horticoccus luteus]
MNTRPARLTAHLRPFVTALAALALPFAATMQAQPKDASAVAAEDPLQLSAFTVTSQHDTGYESMQTTSGLRTVQELKNVANSISILNPEMIQDIGALTIEDMTKWAVTGEANPDPTVVSGSSRLIFRGIQNNYALRNGWIWYSPIDTYSTERMELLRGPNAFLYGEADLGGAQNQITKRGLFTKDFTKIKLTGGSYDLRRAELDLNRRVNDQLAVRFAAVESDNHTWWDHGHRDFRGLYGAVTYRPFRQTTISVIGEYAKSTEIRSQGLFSDNFSYTTPTPSKYNNASGVVYLPVNGASYRLNGRSRSSGPNVAIADPTIVPREYQFNGPSASNISNQKSLTVEVEQTIGENLHLQLSANAYHSSGGIWGATTRGITRDLNPTLPGGAPNPYYNELYTEYQRTHQVIGNVVRDIRLSAVYDLKLNWMQQQFVVNAQQHEDNPGQKYPKMAEFVAPGTANFLGAVNSDATVAAFNANRTVFANNKFIRRYYLKDGDGGNLTGSINPVAGVSDYYPDIGSGASGSVGATGAIIDRHFTTPSVGIGAAGTYFNGHLHTLIGYRRDEFKMKTTSGIPRPLANTWIVDTIPGGFSDPQYVNYKFDGTNYGGVLRINDMLAFTYNYARSYRLSLGEGKTGYQVGTVQGIPFGEGQDIGVRFSFFGGKLELNATYYDNYQPNARNNALGSAQQNVKNELTALFPTTFDVNGGDIEKVTTSGVEVEAVANLTRNWRLLFNLATNEIKTADRLPQLKSFQQQAKALNQPTPQLDAYLLTMPEGVPTAGYTKTRANLFTRYDIKDGALKGLYFGGGANWRGPTFRGNADVNQDGIAEALWSPSYTLVSLLVGYQTKLWEHRTVFALNVDNVFDKDYYRSAAIGSGSWGDPRSFKLSAMVEF